MLTTTIDKNYCACNMFLRLISASVVNIHEDLPGCGRNYFNGQVCVQKQFLVAIGAISIPSLGEIRHKTDFTCSPRHGEDCQ